MIEDLEMDNATKREIILGVTLCQVVTNYSDKIMPDGAADCIEIPVKIEFFSMMISKTNSLN